MSKKIKVLFLAFITITFGMNFFYSKDIYADYNANVNSLLSVSLFSDLEQCYSAGIQDSIQLSDFTGLSSILAAPNTKIYLPATSTGWEIKCSKLQEKILVDNIEKAGYKLRESNSENSSSIKYEYTIAPFIGSVSRKQVTFKGRIETDFSNPSNPSCVGEITAVYSDSNTTIGNVFCNGGILSSGSGYAEVPYPTIELYMVNNEELLDRIKKNFSVMVSNYHFYDSSYGNENYIFGQDDNSNNIDISTRTIEDNDGTSQLATYIPAFTPPPIAAYKATWEISSHNSANIAGCKKQDITISGEWKDNGLKCAFNTGLTYALYYKYVQNQSNVTIQECSSTPLSSGYYVKNAKDQWCIVAINNDNVLNDPYSIVDNSGKLRQGFFEEALTWLSTESSYSGLKDDEYANNSTNEEGKIPTDPEANQDNNFCNDADLAGQNWILCSTGKNLSDTTTGLFKIVEEMLSVNTELYQSDSKVYDFWEFCRNAANIVMIIILLIIIFSQLTGFGIDNYGIKKMLPKLITMAILINVSFFICQIVIDISNIIGSSMDGFFQNITGGTTPKDVITGVVSALVGAGAGGVAAGGTVATVLTLTGATGGIIWVIIGIVLAVYILVGLATIFTMLSLRMVIILVVIGTAPLALACNILPNTKNVFKKWFDAFKAAVIVYPIIGALHGLSAVVRDITFGSDVPFAFIIGCIATILPYYLIPTLLKKAINATGMIGSAITGMGQSLRRGVQQAGNIAKNSEAVKDRANRLGANLNQRYLDRNFDKDGKHLTGQDKKRYQELVDAKRNGQDYDAKELAELEKKNLAGFSARYQRNMARANAAAEARKAKDAQTLAGASSVLSAGRTAEAETRQALADQGAAGALRGYYRDGEGNIYTRVSGNHEYEYKYKDKDGKLQTGKVKANAGDYVRTDKNGVHVLTADQVRHNLEVDPSRRVSQKDATLAQNRINQDKQYGALGAYAAGETRIADAANAANLSSLGSGVDSLTSSIQAGEGEVLQVQHVKAGNKQIIENASNQAFLKNIPQLDLENSRQNVENIALKKAYEEAADNSISIPTPDFEAIKAGALNKQRERDISNMGSLIGNGSNISYVDSHGTTQTISGYTPSNDAKYNPTTPDPHSLSTQLYTLVAQNKQENMNAIIAITRQLKSLGSNGIDAISSVVDTGVFDGKDPSIQSLFRNEITSDAKIKSQDTAFFKAMQQEMFGAGNIATWRGDASKYVDSLKSDYVGSMTDDAFDNIFGKGTYPGLSADPTVQSLAYQALNNPDTVKSLKQKQIDQLRSIIQNYTPPVNAQQQAAQERAKAERMAERRGKGTDTITDLATATTFMGYEYPKGPNGFDNAGTWTIENGDHIYTDSTGKKWNGSTGTYV